MQLKSTWIKSRWIKTTQIKTRQIYPKNHLHSRTALIQKKARVLYYSIFSLSFRKRTICAHIFTHIFQHQTFDCQLSYKGEQKIGLHYYQQFFLIPAGMPNKVSRPKMEKLSNFSKCTGGCTKLPQSLKLTFLKKNQRCSPSAL